MQTVVERWKTLCCLVLIFGLFASSWMTLPGQAASQKDQTTQYRVYQNDVLLKEFAGRNQAIAYAKQFTDSYVEDIETRTWIWSQFPAYRVQVDGTMLPKAYHTRETAVQAARQHQKASVIHLEQAGWIWHNYPRYQVYQGEKTFEAWGFATLSEAKKEANRWSRAHVIDLMTSQWVWDNISDQQEAEMRKGEPIYRVVGPGDTDTDFTYANLRDAVNKARQLDGAKVLHTAQNEQVIYENAKRYAVYQNANLLESFYHIEEASHYAKQWANARVMEDGREIWTNVPYYQVWHDEETRVGHYRTLNEALSVAQSLPQAMLLNRTGKTIWDNSNRLQVWGWNGSSSASLIRQQVSQTIGLDVDSPTWFELADANGTLKDTSSPELVKWLRDQGLEVHPLVHNQFDSKLTSAFLGNAKAQEAFISELVNRCAALGVDGINLDFESLNGSDRARFTAFVTALAEAAHAKGLKLSIDLPRGSIAWNDRTAFDHAALAKVVDTIIIMTYDHHYSGSDVPGSVAGLEWTENGVKEFLSYGIRRDQLVMGIPFYSRLWKLDANGKLVGNRSLLNKDIAPLLASKKTTKTFDSRFGQYRYEYQEDGFTYQFWMEDEETLKARMDIAKKYKLAGVAFWRLGHEPADIWETVVKEK
ncbi:glycoside hydrolase family 18 [Xylanibacillus composti]|uniref:GH18 domain-containing protein n=1 Tax=Xylanibacillus composti TaxID=1572762 RepID=A0A8J4M1B3_9BACL|nr:glycosyl hydrolase family 18 protein [Xylanibacillus composti]MDT9725564.1 glycoside hydrolase family 18 [Xylanibacillus composti]GIQ67657.1 hypothetical protein XYCOK13_04810 [Xylanibacillus composti]